MKREVYTRAVYGWQDAIRQSNLNPLTRLVLLNLSLHMTSAGERCFPGVDLQMAETGLSRTAVFKHLRKAVLAGFIVKTKARIDGAKWDHNVYKPVFPKHYVLPQGGAPDAPTPQKVGARSGTKGVRQTHPNYPLNYPLRGAGESAAVDKSKPFRIEPELSEGCLAGVSEAYPGWNPTRLMRIFDASVAVGAWPLGVDAEGDFLKFCKLYTKENRP